MEPFAPYEVLLKITVKPFAVLVKSAAQLEGGASIKVSIWLEEHNVMVSRMVRFAVFIPGVANVLTGFLVIEVVPSEKVQLYTNAPEPFEPIEVLLKVTVNPLIDLVNEALQEPKAVCP